MKITRRTTARATGRTPRWRCHATASPEPGGGGCQAPSGSDDASTSWQATAGAIFAQQSDESALLVSTVISRTFVPSSFTNGAIRQHGIEL